MKEPLKRKITSLERRRFQAVMQGDTAVLARVLAHSLTYIHSNGHEDSRSSLIESLETKRLRYLCIEVDDIQVPGYKWVAIVTGAVHMKVESRDQTFPLHIRFTDVYVKLKSRWQLVAWQSTRLSGKR